MTPRFSDLVKDWFEEKGFLPLFDIVPGSTSNGHVENPDVTWFDIKARKRPFAIIIDYGNPRMIILVNVEREPIYPADPEFFTKLEEAINNALKQNNS